MLYSYPRFSTYDLGLIRIGGNGLGNLLLPWARFIVATQAYNLTPIAPTWCQLKMGPILRNERDKRFYFDLFHIAPGQISGWRKLLLLSRLPRVPEKQLYNGSVNDRGMGRVIVFEGMEEYFDPISQHHDFVRKELLAITNDKHKKGLEFDFRNSIAIHVRLSDFALPGNMGELTSGCSNLRIPISWYVDVVRQLRSVLGAAVPVYIFSDGSGEELAELLQMSNSRRLSFGSSIADLIALSRAQILVASGSTFSMWASYLGRMPVVWQKGRLRKRLYYECKYAEVEYVEGEGLPNEFTDLLSDSFMNSSDSTMLTAVGLSPTTSRSAPADQVGAEAYRVYHLFGRRVLAIPERPRRLRLMGWQRYQPFTLKRAVVRRFMQLNALLHTDSVFCELVTSPLGYDDPFGFQSWLEQVCEQIGSPAAQPVIIWPPQKDRGRVYVHLLNAGGQPVGFAKISFSDHNDECLSTEVSTLHVLNTCRLQACHVPEVLVDGLWQGHRYVVEEPLPTYARPVSATPGAYPRTCVEEFGGLIRIAKQEEVESFAWWRHFNEIAMESFQPFLNELRDLISLDSGLPVCRVHGDLGSANLALANGRLWVLDWEESTENGPALADEIGYDLTVYAKALHRRPKKELRRFSARHLRVASPAKRRDVMAVLAFRQTIEPSNAELYIRNWDSMIALQES